MGNKDVLKRWLRSGASPLLALGLLAGCAGAEPQPTFTPTLPDSTLTADNDPEPDSDVDPVDELEPPEIPEFSDDPVEAAEQMVDYFIAAYNYGYQASDPEPLLAISHSACGTCNLHVDRMSDQRDAGEYIEGGDLRIRDLEVFLLEKDQVLVETTLSQAAWASFDRDSNKIDEGQAAEITSGYGLVFEDNTWSIRAISNETGS